MKEATMATNAGREALAQFIRKIHEPRRNLSDVTDGEWEDFKVAVAEAQAELRDEDSAGERRWHEERHAADE